MFAHEILGGVFRVCASTAGRLDGIRRLLPPVCGILAKKTVHGERKSCANLVRQW